MIKYNKMPQVVCKMMGRRLGRKYKHLWTPSLIFVRHQRVTQNFFNEFNISIPFHFFVTHIILVRNVTSM